MVVREQQYKSRDIVSSSSGLGHLHVIITTLTYLFLVHNGMLRHSLATLEGSSVLSFYKLKGGCGSITPLNHINSLNQG